MRRLLPLVLLSSCSLYTPEEDAPDGGLDPRAAEGGKLRSLADAFIAWRYAVHPVSATLDGVHDFDARLDRRAKADIEAEIQSLREYLRRVSQVDGGALTESDAGDLLVLRGRIQADLLDLEQIRSWEKNPGYYSKIISGALRGLTSSAAEGRLRQVPELLAVAKENLVNPPALFTEMAIGEFDETVKFVETGLPGALEEARKPALAALQEFVVWMKEDLKPRSKGDFTIGAETYRAKLRFEERVETPLEELVTQGRFLLRTTQAVMKNIAGERPAGELLKETALGKAAADKLLDEKLATLAARNGTSKVRKLFGGAAFEVLFVGEPDAPPALRLQQLALGLLHICRRIVGIEMHTKRMTYEQGVEFFVREGHLDRVNAEREARRGAVDPMYRSR